MDDIIFGFNFSNWRHRIDKKMFYILFPCDILKGLTIDLQGGWPRELNRIPLPVKRTIR